MNRATRFIAHFIGLITFTVLALAEVSAQPLVTDAWLRQHLRDSNLVVLSIFEGDQRAVFASGHIPGAIFTDYSNDGWAGIKSGVAKGMLQPLPNLEELISRFGIDNQTRVVLVPGGRERGYFYTAARIYWTLKMLGHDDVSILEGGDKAWLANTANPVASGATNATPKRFAAHFRPEYLSSREDVIKAIQAQDVQLIDSRPPQQYQGKAKSPDVRVAGTIPGAINVPAQELITADSTRLVDKSSIDAVVAKAGVKSDVNHIVFCNIGYGAPTTWFVMHEVLGNKRVSIYPSGMSDWTSDTALPVVKAE